VAFGPFEFRVQIEEPPHRPRPTRDNYDDYFLPAGDEPEEATGPEDSEEVHLLLTELRRALSEDSP
jgi:hypothetical protein